MSESDHPQIAAEEQGRADTYALLSRLFYAAPDEALLAELRGNAIPDAEKPLLSLVELPATGYPAALAVLREAAQTANPVLLRTEYDEVFIGAGRAAVSPYTSGHAGANAPDRYLVALREQLTAWGLVRREAAYEVEDHVSAVCDVMRWLIEHDRPIDVQMRFFDEFVFRGVETFCDAIDASAATAFYRAVAALARTFLLVESQAFTLHGES